MDDLQLLNAVLTPPEASQEVIDRSRHRLQNGMLTGHRNRRRPWLAGGLAITATAAAATVVAVSSVTSPDAAPNGPPPAAPLTGRQVLLAAATTADREPTPTGTYWYTKISDNLGVWWETWTTRDGETWRRAKGKLTKDSRVLRDESGRITDDLRKEPPFHLVGVDLTFQQLQSLPTEPEALKKWIAHAIRTGDARTSAGRPDAATQREWVFQSLVALLCTLPAPSKVRAAAFRAFAAYPDVKDLGPGEGGRRLRISWDGGKSGATLVIDPTTAQVRESDYIVVNGGEYSLTGDSQAGTAKIITRWVERVPST